MGVLLFLRYNKGMIRIGVLRGGPSSEYEISLKTGENVLKFLPEKYEARDILITKNGKWHFDGVEKPPEKIFRHIDLIFNALHGEFGEDGKLQHILETHRIPFIGSGSFASALGMNKVLAKRVFERAGVKIPRWLVIKKDDDLDGAALKIFKNFSPPWVLKPTNKGSSVGIKIIDNMKDLKNEMKKVLFVGELSKGWETPDKILMEEYISGKEATCGVLENFRGEKHYALPVVEIIPPAKNKFFNYDAKYGGETQEICPADFSLETKRGIEEIAKKAHFLLGCRAYSRADFIVSRRGIFLLETNTLPGLTSESLLPKSAQTIGLNFEDLLNHLICEGLKKR